ncbi:hypothetical protein AHMF7605_03410 [Adhaeribacter arboris]|uniref:Uncharacterized protein n=1 Tax=Adhaeribacter arboris TaxID=2072846 RepID=A0A2T2YAV6_9BACT|nr:hypothetical protein AHMF7605_03410 [Adhaeribacter arboris]
MKSATMASDSSDKNFLMSMRFLVQAYLFIQVNQMGEMELKECGAATLFVCMVKGQQAIKYILTILRTILYYNPL